ncbi:MAG: hopanoid biosynthesis-associated protein HpnK [Verrucomicrobia bacterium]|nr:hopanoid biosynthesis-associated protein HpnK [Verrucomicrobiota bacterium]
MAPLEPPRRLVVNADDFGRSRAINTAVIRAHREGILTTASLMVNGAACDEAVQFARENPKLGVGLHLSLVCGTSALKHADIPDLVDQQGNFSNDPVGAGFRYFVCEGLRPQFKAEIAAQFEKFRRTGLPLDHVNGHLNLHLHPVIFDILCANSVRWGIRHLRVTRDLFWLNARLASGQWLYRASHAAIFALLSWRARFTLARLGVRHTRFVFGLLQNARVDENYVLKLLPELPSGDSELYSHPSLDEFRNELDALISPQVAALVRQSGIQLIRYQDLA